MHPDNKIRGGTVVIIRNNIQNHERKNFTKNYLQTTSVTIENEYVLAMYCPLKHDNKKY